LSGIRFRKSVDQSAAQIRLAGAAAEKQAEGDIGSNSR
jgi:hypothetical protein